jgi:Flp pilus assembly protein TadG
LVVGAEIMMRSIVRAVRAFAWNFGAAKAGNVAMIYALALLPSLAAVGAAIDLTRAMVVKMRLGEALDAAGLAVGGTIGLSEAQMTAKAQKFFYANYPSSELGTVTSLSIATGGSNNNLVTVSGTARLDTTFMGLFGVNYLDVAVTVEVTRESKGLEIALVLDNTGSMSGSKLTALKSATNELIGILFGDEDTPAHLKMSLVPFSQTVKVDTTTFLDNDWMDENGESSTAKLNFNNNKYAFSVWQSMSNKSWGGCLEARPNGYEETDDPPDLSISKDTFWVPYFEPDGPDNASGYTNYLNDGTTGSADTRLRRSAKYVGKSKTEPNSDCNMQKILPLTNNKATIQGYVNGMIATGYTHIAIGAGWGWRTLSPTAPYTEGSPYGDPDWTKAMVFLTDGLNTVDSNSTWHQSTYTAYNFLQRGILGTTDAGDAEEEQDERTSLVCSRIKDAGIRIYTILLQEQSARAKNLMEGCASDDETANASVPKCNGNADKLCYESPSASDLTAVFQSIALDLSNLRLSH